MRERDDPRRWVIDGKVEGGDTFERESVHARPNRLLLDRLVLRHPSRRALEKRGS